MMHFAAKVPHWVMDKLQNTPGLIGALSYTSHASGSAGSLSNINLLVVMVGEDSPAAEWWYGPDGIRADVQYATLAEWRHLPEWAHWQHFALSQGRPIYDPQKVVQMGLVSLQTPPDSHLQKAPQLLDSYLGAAYRSVSAWRAQDELGARLYAQQSLTMLLDALYRLAGAWTPYWDQMAGHWTKLQLLGIDVSALRTDILQVSRMPTDTTQVLLYRRISRWMQLNGYQYLLEAWDSGFHRAMNAASEGASE